MPSYATKTSTMRPHDTKILTRGEGHHKQQRQCFLRAAIWRLPRLALNTLQSPTSSRSADASAVIMSILA
eukprot:105581-Amphidinium_carterae.1